MAAPPQFPKTQDRLAVCAVVAVAIGDRLKLPLTELRRLREAVEQRAWTGDPELDAILRFVADQEAQGVLGTFPVPEAVPNDAIGRAYRRVAPVIQAAGTS